MTTGSVIKWMDVIFNVLASYLITFIHNLCWQCHQLSTDDTWKRNT